jgi:putrescine aminotransferase
LPSFLRNPVAVRHARHVNAAFVELLDILGFGRVYTRAAGAWIWDEEGRRYLDALAGFGALNLGHNPPRIAARIKSFLDSDAPNLYHVGPSPYAADLARALAERLPGPLSVAMFSNSGAEAVEAGIKLARAATRRPGLVYCEGGYHGTNLGTLSVMDAARLRAPFEPLLADCQAVPFGDLAALERVLASGRIAAFVVEPIQAEAGVRMPPAGYLRAAAEACRRHGALLVLDEVQTGLARTGSLFAFETEDFVPDVIALAKSLGGGMTSIGATLTSEALHRAAYGSADRFDLHSSTFGGHSLACVAALETLAAIDDERLAAHSATAGARLLECLRERLAGHPLVADVRGRGLLVGVEIGPTGDSWTQRLSSGVVTMAAEKVIGQWIAVQLLERGVLCQPAARAWNVLKLQPPLVASVEEIELLAEIVGDVFDANRRLPQIAAGVSARLVKRSVTRVVA